MWHKHNCSSENSYLIYCIVTSVNIFLSVKKSRFHIYLCHLLKNNKILNIQIIMADDAIEFSTALTGNIKQQKGWLRVNDIRVVTWRKIYIFNFINCYINCCKKKEYPSNPAYIKSQIIIPPQKYFNIPLKSVLTWEIKTLSPSFLKFFLINLVLPKMKEVSSNCTYFN